MQSLAAFYEDNKALAIGASVAAALVLIIVVVLLYRLLFGRRLRAAGNGRSRQPRLGIVDAYDLDRQRQLVLVRRDNVEHLIMIGGPTDVVIESAIIRAQSAPLARDKDSGAPVIGTVTAPAVSPGAPQATLPPAAPSASLPPGASRTEPPIGVPSVSRTEPPLGIAMPSPIVERAPADRSPSRPIAVPDPAAPAGPPQPGSAQPPARTPPPRPSTLPPRPLPVGGPQPGAVSPQGAGQAPPSGSPTPDRPVPARPPLPPRPPLQRTPLPPRPNLAASLPPRPARPLPGRSEAQRPETVAPDDTPAAGTTSGTTAEPDRRIARGPEPAPSRAEPGANPPKTIETLESLEEEMAKLLGRPSPRRDG